MIETIGIAAILGLTLFTMWLSSIPTVYDIYWIDEDDEDEE